MKLYSILHFWARNAEDDEKKLFEAMVLDLLDPTTTQLTVSIFLDIIKKYSIDINYERHVILLESYYGLDKSPGSFKVGKFEVTSLFD